MGLCAVRPTMEFPNQRGEALKSQPRLNILPTNEPHSVLRVSCCNSQFECYPLIFTRYFIFFPKMLFTPFWSCVPHKIVCMLFWLCFESHAMWFIFMFGTAFVQNIIACSHSTHSCVLDLRYRCHRSTPVPPQLPSRKKRHFDYTIRTHSIFGINFYLYKYMFTLLRLLLHQNNVLCCVVFCMRTIDLRMLHFPVIVVHAFG